MPVFPSEEWIKALQAVLESDEEYKKAGADWEGDIITIVEAEPGKLDQPFCYYSKPHRGELVESFKLNSPADKTAEYTISGPYSVWKSIVKREADAMQMMMKGKVRVKGDMQKLLRYAKFQQLGMKALQKVETTFIDD